MATATHGSKVPYPKPVHSMSFLVSSPPPDGDPQRHLRHLIDGGTDNPNE
jgi:hypothetical protein